MLELTALIFGLQTYERLLSACQTNFIVRSDCLSLTFLKSLRMSKSSKLARFSCYLDSFKFSIQHLPGKDNGLSDWLSRASYHETEEEKRARDEAGPMLGIDLHSSLNALTEIEEDSYLANISDEFFVDHTPSDRQLDKSRNRHRRHHSLVAFLAPPIAAQPTDRRKDGRTDGNCCKHAAAPVPPTHAAYALHDEHTSNHETTDGCCSSSSSAAAAKTRNHAENDDSDVIQQQNDSADQPTDVTAYDPSDLNLVVSLDTQRSDPFFDAIITYIQTGILPDDRQRARSIVIQSDFFKIENDQLLKLIQITHKKQNLMLPYIKVLCLPVHLRIPVLENIHDRLCHPPIEKSYFSLRKVFYWKDMYADLVHYIRSCTRCHEIRHTKRKPLYLRQQDMPSQPFETVHLDFVGPIVSYQKSNFKYILTAACRYTLFVNYEAMVDCSAQKTAATFVDRIVCQYGAPLQIVTDRGASFLNSFMAELTKLAGIRHLRTSSFHPQANSGIEGFHKFLGVGLRALIDPSVPEWSRVVKMIQYSQNTLELPSLGTSAHQLLYHQRPRLFLQNDIINATRNSGVQHFPETMLPRLSVYRKFIEELKAENQRKNKEYFDKFARPIDIKIGDLVYKELLGTPASSISHVSSKLRDRFSGPFRVIDVFSNSARLQRLSDGKILPALVNITQLKKTNFRRSELLEKYRTITPTATAPPAEVAQPTNEQDAATSRNDPITDTAERPAQLPIEPDAQVTPPTIDEPDTDNRSSSNRPTGPDNDQPTETPSRRSTRAKAAAPARYRDYMPACSHASSSSSADIAFPVDSTAFVKSHTTFPTLVNSVLRPEAPLFVPQQNVYARAYAGHDDRISPAAYTIVTDPKTTNIDDASLTSIADHDIAEKQSDSNSIFTSKAEYDHTVSSSASQTPQLTISDRVINDIIHAIDNFVEVHKKTFKGPVKYVTFHHTPEIRHYEPDKPITAKND
jgi:hypothetical protein